MAAAAASYAGVLYDPQVLETHRAAWRNGAPALVSAVDVLLAGADDALSAGPFSVTFKDETPPSGDKRDYMSQGPYWWPNPDTDDGLPYVRRDGERNPEGDRLDRQSMGRMASAATTLALAWFFTGREDYARHGAELLRTWFLSPETGMNPHLEYGQRIPGRTEGRGIGIIDSRSLIPVCDAALLLRTSEAWTDAEHEALQAWFRTFFAWLLESDHGRDEARHPNNHGTWYDAQVAAFALFVGDTDRARNTIAVSARARLKEHIEPDGRQPHELGRTLPAAYSMFNIEGYVELADMGERLGLDLWRHETDDGRSLRAALDYLVQYAFGEHAWPYEDLRGPNWERLAPTLRRAAVAYDAPEYEALLQRMLGDDAPAQRFNLLYPAP